VIGPFGPQDPSGQVTSFLHHYPLVIGDARSLTDAGFIDDDENPLVSLIRAANDDLNVTRGGIVFVDETKKARAGLASRT
jgi:ATP-dependent protease Clp ATPase subunit